jgi:hypothetical protein
MKSEKWLDLTCECFIWQNLLPLMPADFPAVRELRIQNAKLQRMLMPTRQRDEYEGMRQFLGGASVKKARKREGKHDAEVGQQAKKVKALAEQSFKQWLRKSNLMTNKEFQEWKRKFYIGMDESVKGMKKRIKQRRAAVFFGEAEPPATK